MHFLILLCAGILYLSIFFLFFTQTPTAQAATRADCNARAEAEECKEAVNQECDGKTGEERTKCIERVLTKYTVTALGSGPIKDCSFEESQKAEEESKSGGTTNRCLGNLPKAHDTPAQIRRILSIALGIAGGVALIALMIAAFNYATAGTDMDKVARSKKSIVTALIGVVIAVTAQALVLTVLGKL